MPELFNLMAESSAFFLSFIFIVSLMMGSFLNVVIYRLPIMMERSWKEEYLTYFQPELAQENSSAPFNLIKPDSSCPHCQHKIRAWENIPLLSWLMLKGRCSQCKNPISIRYPLVELATGLLSLLVAWHFGFGTQAFAAVFLTWVLVALTCIDLDKMLLPDQMTLPLLWFGLMLSTGEVFVSSFDAIIGAAAGYLSLWSLYWAFKLLTGKEGMGYGDFKLLAALGAFLGWQQLPIVILLSSFVGAVIGISMIVLKGRDKGKLFLSVPTWP
jgi:leader peptidase (prepilin peptidase) / N-methyltransferase